MEEKKLADALYALNRVIPMENERENLGAIERMNMNLLIVARDLIWSQLQAINPNEWKD
jgi:hypothetical protein